MATEHEPRRAPGRELEVDTFDANLIRALQEDGRASIHDLATQLEASRDYVSQRLRHLIDREGLRIVAALDPGFVGHHVLVHTRVEVDGPIAPMSREIAEHPDAVFVSITSGALPLTVESRHGDLEELHAMLDQLRRFPSVRRLTVSTYVEILKGFFVSHQREPFALDSVDHKLISVLQGDGRISYRALAEAAHLSPSSARARVQRLIDAGVIRISALKSGGISRNRLAIGVGITASGDPAPVRQFIHDAPDVDFAARSHGTYDFIATLVGSSSAHLLTVLDRLRAIPEAGSIDTWMHYDIVKEDYARSLGRVLSLDASVSRVPGVSRAR